MKELYAALVKARDSKDRWAEARLLKEYADQTNPIRRINQHTAPPLPQLFMSKLIYGTSGCWYWRGNCDQTGYGRMNAFGENRAHRIAWRLFLGDIPNGLKVLHKCDVPQCCNPDHLFLGTQQDNIADMNAKGRQRTLPRFGEDNHLSKLTGEQVLAMRQEYASGEKTYKSIAERFGVSTMTAYRAINKQAWGHL